MLKPPDQAKFWRLLADYEALTQRESVAVRHGDFPSVEEAQRLKEVIFPVWQQLGQELHLNRANCPELRQRLETISAAEAANLEAIYVQQAAIRQKLGDLAASRQRLQKVGKNYQDPPAYGGAATAGFAARG